MIRAKCEECGGRVVRKTVSYDYLGEHIGKFQAEVCSKCGEVVFDEGVSNKIEQRVKQKGLYGLGATTRVGIAGSSFFVRITKKLAAFLKLRKGAQVHLHPEGKNRIVLEIPK